MFSDRRDAGRQLAQSLRRYRGPDTLVLGLPRGGVPVAAEVAAALGAPLDVVVVRKLGVPYQPELAMGAVGEGDVMVVNDEVVRHLHMSEAELSMVAARERQVVAERARRFRPDHPALSLAGKVAVIVDDGIATGSTAHAACAVTRAAGAELVVLAVPVAPADSHPEHWPEVDEFVCLQRPHRFYAVGQFYDDFGQTTDDEVVALLKLAAAAAAPVEQAATGGPEPVRHIAPEHPALDEDVDIPVAGTALPGHVTLPAGAGAIVLFAHGSGSSRHSPRNRYVATVLQEGGLGTLLFDLLTPAEEAHRSNVFDIDLLAERLVTVTDWVVRQPWGAPLQVGYFGASTGAAAALAAAAVRTRQIAAVVSRGGRPDLAIPVLDRVTAPTLLIVGSHDEMVLELNRRAQRQLTCECDLAVVPGATHLFEEPGTLAQAARLARDWFLGHLAVRGSMTA
ncbi:phosphoribosyltransferase family protein [Knoellia sp. p5-6-4]|uniref:phosphoribosyltransferase family protein n=1 Tax=unclassified Knoellia TaxID=2618719 RepID=UPI0023DB12D8|nr:phosphoribosyltransferase family protein [Knoellia sp. p5-6-4]MDF2144632.1 phosphoribosyltransferase family protein [Knoellia sp. p5-6-4]